MNIRLNIDPRHEEVVRHILRTFFPGYEVWAFGSRVHGRNVSRYSDLDLVIISGKTLDMRRLVQLRDAFSESDLPFKVDVLDWAAISSTFREIIKKDYIEIQTLDNLQHTGD